MTDIEKARAKRARLVEREQARNVLAMAGDVLGSLPEVAPGQQVTTLVIALIGLADAHGLEREWLIESFGTVARAYPFPAAVLE